MLTGGSSILDETGSDKIGEVTSGCPSPSLKKNVALGYVTSSWSAVGQQVKLEVRKMKIDAEIVKLPFIPTKYFTVN